MAAIDDVLPRYDVHEVHSIALAVEPARALAAALAAPVARDPIVRALLRARGLRANGTIAEAFEWMGFAELSRTESEVVFGGAGTPWRPGRGIRALADARPGDVRIAADFRADGVTLTTETRVAAFDDAARRAFRRYWLVVRPFSALIRRRWLAQIARSAG